MSDVKKDAETYEQRRSSVSMYHIERKLIAARWSVIKMFGINTLHGWIYRSLNIIHLRRTDFPSIR
jgi:hypothetical protein